MSEYIERGALEAKAVYMHGFGKNKYVPLKAIQEAPAADVVEVKHGEWIGGYHTHKGQWVYTKPCCSICSFEQEGISNYCPNCGAKMRGDGE